MTEQRKSAVIAKETTFATGVKDGAYCRLPTGYHIQHEIQTPGSSVYETGNKIRVGATYGPIEGSWQINYNVDYDNLELMTMAYDDVITFKSSGSKPTKYTTKNNTAEVDFGALTDNTGYHCSDVVNDSVTITDLVSRREYYVDLGSKEAYYHIFIQRNNSRPDHYVIREKILHRIVNERSGAGDEITEMWGAIPASFEVSKSSSSSEMSAGINGLYADQKTVEGNLDTTDYTPLDGDTMTQQACMWIGSSSTDGFFVEDMDSFSVSTTNQIQLVKNMCSRVAGTYMEGRNTFKWNATTYHNDVTRKFLRRVFTGGAAYDKEKPMNKNLAPLPIAKFMTFNGDPIDYSTSTDPRAAAYKASDRSIAFIAKNSTLRNMTWPMGSGDLMKQNMQSVECDEVYVVVRNGSASVWDNTVTSADSSETYKTFTTAVYTHVLTQTTPANGTAAANLDEWASEKKLSVKVGTNTIGVPNYMYLKYKQGESVDYTVPENCVIVPYDTTSDSVILKNHVGGRLSPVSGPDQITTGTYCVKSKKGFTSSETGLSCYVETKYDSTKAPSTSASAPNPSDSTCYVRVKGTATYKGVDRYLLAKPATVARFTGSTVKTETEEMTLLGILRIEVY